MKTIINAVSTGLLFFLCFNASAADLDSQTKALQVVSDFADKLCSSPPLKGSETNYELSGSAKAELSEVLKKVVDLGIEGSGKYATKEYEGLLQKDLATLVKDSSNCRLEVWRDLKDKLVPKVEPMSTTNEKFPIRVKSFPHRPGQASGVKLTLYIDDEEIGSIGNIPKMDTFDVGTYEEGLHTFRFEDIDGYYVDMFGNYQKVSQVSGLECEGDFGVTRSKTLQLVVWMDPSGYLTCDLK